MDQQDDEELPAEKPAAKEQRAVYAERRNQRVAHYYFVRRVIRPTLIYEHLILECRECLGPDVGDVHSDTDLSHIFVPIISRNRASGIRMIGDVLKELRAEAEPEEILKLRRPIETAKVRQTYEYLLQKAIEVIEDNSYVKVQKVSPSGLVVSILEPRCSKQDKARAFKAAQSLTEKLGRLDGAELVAADDGQDKPGADEAKPAERFAFNFPNVNGTANDLDEMVAMNLGRDKLN